MSSKNSEQVKPIFRGIGTGTHCYECKHVRGHNSPNPIYWSCAAEKVIGVPFQNDGKGNVIRTDTEPCPLFKKDQHTLEMAMTQMAKERMLGAALPEKITDQPEEEITSPGENVLNWLIKKGHTAIRRKSPERVAATLKREIEKSGDHLIREQKPGQDSVTIDGQMVSLPFTNCFCTIILRKNKGQWNYAVRAEKDSKEFTDLMFIILDEIISKN